MKHGSSIGYNTEYMPTSMVEDIIQSGVKETNHVDVMKFFDNKMEDTLENGVKHTFNTEYMPKSMVVDIIDNGVKSSIPRQYVGENIIDTQMIIVTKLWDSQQIMDYMRTDF